MEHICCVDGCYGRGKYLSDKADWFCEEHKPEKLFDSQPYIVSQRQTRLENLKAQRNVTQKNLDKLNTDIEKIEKEMGDKYGHI